MTADSTGLLKMERYVTKVWQLQITFFVKKYGWNSDLTLLIGKD